jgi:hypothetical protein
VGKHLGSNLSQGTLGQRRSLCCFNLSPNPRCIHLGAGRGNFPFSEDNGVPSATVVAVFASAGL